MPGAVGYAPALTCQTNVPTVSECFVPFLICFVGIASMGCKTIEGA